MEYVTGTKGDMLCRYLNKLDPEINPLRNNKTMPLDIGTQNWLKVVYPEDLTLEKFEKVLFLNELQYLPSHPLWVCYDKRFMEAVKNHGYEILSLKFEPKHYVTIRIEGVIKNSAIYSDNVIARINRKGGSWSDTLSVEENSKRLLRQLELGPTGLYIQRAKYNRLFNEMTENRTLLHYEELFCSDLPFPLQPERKEEWLNLVERSWCDYDENEYRKWIIPEDAYEGPQHRFLQTIQSLIENKKWGLWKDE